MLRDLSREVAIATPRALAWIAVAVLAVLLVPRRDAILGAVIDAIVEGDSDPRFLREGRHSGTWVFQGDERELAELAGPSWHRIEIRAEAVAPSALSSGTLRVGERELPFDLEPTWSAWATFAEPLPDLTPRAYGNRVELTLEAARLPRNDWLYVFFGVDADGGRRGFAYARP